MAAARRLIIGGGGASDESAVASQSLRPRRGIVWISQIAHVFCFLLKVMLGSSSLPPPPTQPLRSAMHWREVSTAASEGGSERVSLSFRIHVGGGCFVAWVEHQMPPDLQLCSKSDRTLAGLRSGCPVGAPGKMPSPGTGPAPVSPPQVRGSRGSQGHPGMPPWSVKGLSNRHDHSVTATPALNALFGIEPRTFRLLDIYANKKKRKKSRRQPVVVQTPVDSQLRPLLLPICTTVAETGSQSPVLQSTVSFPLNQVDALVRTPTLSYLRITRGSDYTTSPP